MDIYEVLVDFVMFPFQIKSARLHYEWKDALTGLSANRDQCGTYSGGSLRNVYQFLGSHFTSIETFGSGQKSDIGESFPVEVN